MTAVALTFDEYMKHETTSGRRNNYLRGWTKKGQVDVWLHTRVLPIALWQHGWQRVMAREDKQTNRKWLEIWGDGVNCLEPEDVLRKQYRRDPDSGERELPPTLCPMCKMIEHVYQEILAGRMGFAEPLFRFEAPTADKEKERTLHAGGITNLFNKDDLDEAQKKAMAAQRVYQKDAWQQNAMSKCKYVFCVVDNAEPQAGVQIAVETTLLGDKVRGVIRDQITNLGPEEGNPFTHPYAIQWQYKPTEKEFNKKYHALPLTRLALREEIRALIYETAPPDTSRLTAPPNLATLRSVLERHAIGVAKRLPWDEFFGPAEQLIGAQAPDEGAASFDPGKLTPPEVGAGEVGRAEDVINAAEQAALAAKAPEPAPASPSPQAAADEEVSCDKCAKAMLLSQTVCPHCGHDYDPKPPPAAAKPPPRSRSAAMGTGPAQPPAAQPSAPKAPEPPPAPAPTDAGQGTDELPW
jgi:hypothetical protein